MVVLILGFNVSFVCAAQGTKSDPIIDSEMNEFEAFRSLDPRCSVRIKSRQKILTVRYYSFDGAIHQGQIIIDRRLARDIKLIFQLAFAEKFPIASVIPVSDLRYFQNGRWSDDLSMAANNTSGFNYREKTGGGSLSKHALGWAVDINPKLNPYIKGETVLPLGANYDPQTAGALSKDHPIVKKFLELGWVWGGDWETLKDYQHFEKDLSKEGKN